MNQITEAVGILTAAKEQIKNILTDRMNENHSLKIQSAIQREIEYLSFITGIGDLSPAKAIDLPPAKTIAGQAITHTGKKQQFDVTPEETAVQALKAKAERAYQGFLKEDSKTIRKEYEDTVIRAVAKKAGMKHVTMDDPEVIDVRFIDLVKSEVVKAEQFKLEQNEARNVKPGQPVLDRQDGVIGNDDVEDAFDEDNKATSADIPDSVEEIENLKEERESEKEAAKSTPKPSPAKKK